MQIHISDPWASPWGNLRAVFYGASATPIAWFDGVSECRGAYPDVDDQYLWYRSEYEARSAVPTDITIEMTGRQTEEATFEIAANVCVEPGGSAKTMRIYMVQVLDHWPAFPTYHRNGFKQAALTEDVTLDPGQCQDVVRTFTFDTESLDSQQNIKIIAWAQEATGLAPAEVYQAATMSWPFPEPEPIPTVGEWGLIAMAQLLLCSGTILIRQRRRQHGGASV